MTRTDHTTPAGPRGARWPLARGTRRAAVAALALLAAAACTDVTTQPRSAISSNNVFGDPTAYRAAVAKLYGTLALSGQEGSGSSDIQGIDAGFGQYLRAYWNLQQLPTDETVLAWNDQSAGVQELNTQTWTTSNGTTTAMFARILLQATLASEYLRQTTDEQLAARNASAELRTEVQRYRAEARFLRALSYWHGLDLFGSLPLVTESSTVGAAAPTQASRQELFDFVVSELQAIRTALPAPTRAARAAQYGRATQAAADMLLAKLYLNAAVYTGSPRWADAQAAAQRVIATNAFELEPVYQRLFLADNNQTLEFVFAVPQDGARTQNFGGTTYLAHAPLGNALNDNAERDFGVNGGWFGLRTRPEFVSLFGGALATDRRNVLFSQGQALNITNLTEFGQGYLVPKYRNVTRTGQGGSDLTFADIDFPMFRLADAYLMYAEAVVRNNGSAADRATALGYVNALRTRASSPTITDAQLTADFLLDERGRELYWEGHRRTDLIRYGRFTGGTKLWQWKGNTQAGTATDASRNIFPIPAIDLTTNPNLRQNPGY
jgi:hypothetical protein